MGFYFFVYPWLLILIVNSALSPCLHMGRPSKGKATKTIKNAGKERLNLHFVFLVFFIAI
jgi:hypothetical protein